MEESAPRRQSYREEDPAVWQAAESQAQRQPLLVWRTPDWFRKETGHSHVVIPLNTPTAACLGFGSSLESAKRVCIQLLTVRFYRHLKYGEPLMKGEPIYQELIEDPFDSVSHQVVPDTWATILAMILVSHELFARWLEMGVFIPETSEGKTHYSMVSAEQFKAIVAARAGESATDQLPT